MQYRNEVLKNESHQEETTRLTQLASQIKKDQTGRLAFELLLQKELQRIQKKLSYQPSADETDYLKQQMEVLQRNIARYGFKTGRAILTTFAPATPNARLADYQAQICYNRNLSPDHAQKLNALNTSQYRRIYGKPGEEELSPLGNFCPEVFGLNVTPDYLAYEKFGSPVPVKDGEKRETLYWTHLETFAPWFKNLKTSAPNALQSRIQREYRRVAAIFMLTVEESKNENLPRLTADAFSAHDTHVAIISRDRKTSYHSALFPIDSLKEKPVQRLESAILKDLIILNNEVYELFIVSTARHAGIIPAEMLNIALILSCTLILVLYYSPFFRKKTGSSISTQLNLSIFITAIIPVIAMGITSDFFLNANFSANLLKNRNTIRSYLFWPGRAFQIREVSTIS